MHEKLIRHHLRNHICNIFWPKTYIIEEFGVSHGYSRIDMAAITFELHGYEIKSDDDTLERLPEQIHYFENIFDRLTIVTGAKHLDNILEIVPAWCGILVAKRLGGFATVRQAKQNHRTNSKELSKLLWKNEATSVLKSLHITPSVSKMSRRTIYEEICAVLTKSEIRERVIKQLIKRFSSAPALQHKLAVC